MKNKKKQIQHDAWSIDYALQKWLIPRLKQFLLDDEKWTDHEEYAKMPDYVDYVSIVKECIILLEESKSEDIFLHDFEKGPSKLQQALEKLTPIIHYLWT